MLESDPIGNVVCDVFDSKFIARNVLITVICFIVKIVFFLHVNMNLPIVDNVL